MSPWIDIEFIEPNHTIILNKSNHILLIYLYIKEMQNIKATKQKKYTNEKKYYDELLYKDNNITIEFSHEKLLLGKLKNKIIDSNFIKVAKEAYIKAMPDGNGRIYRSLIHEIEKIRFQNTTQYFPINEPSNVNPVLLTYKYYTMLLYKIGIRRKKSYKSQNWVKKFIAFTELNLFQIDKEEFFNILKYLRLLFH